MLAPQLSSPMLLATESGSEFARFKSRFVALVQPKDVIEEIWADDVVMLVWEIERYRRMKAALIDAVRTVALMNVLALVKGNFFGGNEEKEIAAEWFEDAAGRERVLELLHSRDLNETAIDSEAVRLRLRELETLDTRIASAQNRRDRVLQQIAEYRSCFAQALTCTSKVVEHAPARNEVVHAGD